MGMLINILFIGIICYCSFKFGQATVRTTVANVGIDNVLSRAKIPVGVAEKIEGHYYLYEKDTTNFLCQAPTLEELPTKLFESKKITLAVVMCPEETASQVYWCINGKLKTVNI